MTSEDEKTEIEELVNEAENIKATSKPEDPNSPRTDAEPAPEAPHVGKPYTTTSPRSTGSTKRMSWSFDLENDTSGYNSIGQHVKHAQKPNDVRGSLVQSEHEYIKLSLQFESELIKHKLAMKYYEWRAFYYVFLPVTLIGTFITIIGFLISGPTQYYNEDNGGVAADGGSNNAAAARFLIDIDGGASNGVMADESKKWWSLAVGVLGAITTLLNSIGKRTNYQSQFDMHRSAVKALEKILLHVKFERDWFERGLNSDDDDAPNQADLKSHQASFKAMLDACCDSPVPNRVEQAFTVLEQVYTRHGVDAKRGLYYYHKLWKEFSTYWLWPWKTPSILVAAKYKEWKKEYDNDDVSNANAIPDYQVWTIPCCKKSWELRRPVTA